MRRRGVFAAVAVVALLVSGTVWAAGLGPRMLVPQGVPDDVSAIVDRTWPAFLGAFPARHECIGDVTLLLVFDVEGGAASYRPEEATIRIEIPTTPERFEESLAHELGHHLEHRCPVATEIGAEFLAAQDMDADAEWFHRDPWFDSPTEHFAESVVQIVLGERRIHADRITLSSEAIATVREWGRRVGGPAG